MGVGVGYGLVITSKGGVRVVEPGSPTDELGVKPWTEIVKLKTAKATVTHTPQDI